MIFLGLELSWGADFCADDAEVIGDGGEGVDAEQQSLKNKRGNK
jgi:hypothetical protein